MRRDKAQRYILAAPAGGMPQMRRLPQSRIKMVATIVGILLAVAPAPWAAMRYEEADPASSGTRTAGGENERLEVVPGSATNSRDGTEQPAARVGQDTVHPAPAEMGESAKNGLWLDLGELQAGTSRVYADVIRLKNASSDPLMVHVEATGLGEAPTHASVSGTEAPGVFTIPPKQSVPVDLGIAADILAQEGEVFGALEIESASGKITRTIPARLTVRPPPQESVLAELLGDNANPNAGIGLLNDLALGLEKPEFVIDGVLDGGLYATDITVGWKPVGPLTHVRASFDGAVTTSRTWLVTGEGDHKLELSGLVLGSVPFSKTVTFRIDKTPPNVLLVSSTTQVANAFTLGASVKDASRIAGVDFVVRRLPAEEQAQSSSSSSQGGWTPSQQQQQHEPSPRPTPKDRAPEGTAPPYSNQYQEPSPSPRSSQSASASPSPSPSPSPKPTASPTPRPSPSPAQGASQPPAQQQADPYAPVRYHASYDESTGLWRATVDLEPGYYEVYAYVVDQLGNARESVRQRVEAVAPVQDALADGPR